MTRSEITRCWIRRECLGMMHVNQNKFISDQEQNSTDVDIDLTNNNGDQYGNGGRGIEESLTRRMQDGITDYRSHANDCNTSL